MSIEPGLENAAAVLLVDDDRNNLLSLEKIFKRETYRVHTASDGKDALDLCRAHAIDVVVTDLMMPGMGGDELLAAVKAVSPDTEVVLMTAYGSVEAAVEAMKNGAYDFVEKPLKRAAIVKTVRKALEKHSLVVENRSLKDRLSRFEKRSIVGNSPVFRHTLELAMQAAPSMANVLVAGESGTGKELVARAIHENSARPGGPFVAVNCAALPETIMEAELFGYERGAFTGAVQQRDGRFAAADGGTIFLDEVGEMSPAVQVKLLRVLQEGEFEPLGGQTRNVDVRVVAATNRELEEEVKRGAFREDLYYRLNVIVITLPPLRQRMEDVPLLVEHFISKYAARNSKQVDGITAEASEVLSGYYWPGNVRELENVVERAVVLTKERVITVTDLPQRIAEDERYQGQLTFAIGTPLAEMELRMIRETLRDTKGDKKLAARLLGIATRTIYRKLESMSEQEGH
ncbi:MAG: sigma-54-dependent Fis family transcriptional regulator [Deltaproteobacteria bacterium]|jgi:two-component system response regulator HydG|nr:sigma-54-dependent Fis family transcriptional regulator [Deltaproteobacteria bacterium]MBW2531952.1 sigma-54-dependent Fis family transcriptional regulator [Deltaproteobacteria bacterium]